MNARRCALWIWYRGDAFRGYQTQAQPPTVQQTLERGLRTVGVHGFFAASGRTDKGVHARKQVLSGHVGLDVPIDSLAERLTAALPETLGVCAAVSAHPSFHAQWSCAGKEYRYRLALGPIPELWRPFAWAPSEHPRLEGADIRPERVAELLGACVGTRDFIAFHEKSSPRKPRTLEQASLVERGDGLFEARLFGNGFGRYQVRYLVGSAVAAAAGVLPEEAFRRALEAGEAIAGVRAAAEALLLWDVRYPGELDPFSPEPEGARARLPRQAPFV